MIINFSNLLLYTKKNKFIVSLCFILIFILTVSFIYLNNYKVSYQEELKLNLTMQEKLDAFEIENVELKDKILLQKNKLDSLNKKNKENKKIISDKDLKIKNLESEIDRLKKQLTKNSSYTASTSTKTNTSSKIITNINNGDYGQAKQVWNALRNIGLNKYVVAGILGNIMAEVGGQTLDISRWPQYSNENYYGICQWGGPRRKRLLNEFGPTLENQIKFLCVELFEIIPKGSQFYSLQDEKAAALYFAKYYEVCSSKYYSVRQINATKALQYFT